MDFFSVANNSLVYILVVVAIGYVFTIAAIFARKSWNRAIDLGINKDVLKKVVKSSLVFTVVPSIAIVIGIFALAPVLGIPWPWLRLSVVGSVSYELMAADMAASGMGTTLPEVASGGIEAFGNIMFVMTAGISSGVITLLILGRKIMDGVQRINTEKSDFGRVVTSCFMIALLAVFLPGFVTHGGVYILTFITSILITLLQGFIIKKYRVLWLTDFVLAFSLVLGMASSVLWTNILG